MYVIRPITTSEANGKFRISSMVGKAECPRELWFELDVEHRAMITTDTMDTFVTSCLLPAMREGADMVVEGVMSRKLYYNFTHYLIPIMKIYFPELHMIAIRPQSLHDFSDAYSAQGGVMTGFSGGIDSYCNYYDHSGDRSPPEYHITHFVYNNVGSHGQDSLEESHTVYMQRFRRIQEAVRREGKPLISFNSNIDDIIKMNFQQTHTFRNTAVAMLTQKTIGKYMYASAFPFSKVKVTPSDSLDYMDPVIFPLLSTERLECIGSGAQHTRVEKTMRVVHMHSSREFLDVCVHPHDARDFANCSFCWKCMRTQATLSILGKLDDYNKVFDVALYRRFEKLFLIEVLNSSTPFHQEIADLIRVRHYPVSRSIRTLVAVLPEGVTMHITNKLIAKIKWKSPKLSAAINALLRL